MVKPEHYPNITHEMHDVVVKTLSQAKENKVLGDLTTQDCYRLSGGQESNDMIVDSYFRLVETKVNLERGSHSLFAFNTKAFDHMGEEEGNSFLSSTLKKLDVFAYKQAMGNCFYKVELC